MRGFWGDAKRLKAFSVRNFSNRLTYHHTMTATLSLKKGGNERSGEVEVVLSRAGAWIWCVEEYFVRPVSYELAI
jgi:hypothetical protein